jgi:pimeloyl-ACP methyl ester carboxylesterase
MTTHCIAVGGASNSSGVHLQTVIEGVINAYNLDAVVHYTDVCSTRKLREKAKVIQQWAGPVVWVAKSLGAIRAFRAIAKGGLRCDGMVSIDPLNAIGLIYPFTVKPPKWLAAETANVYQAGKPRGLCVEGATNIIASGCDHMSIVTSKDVENCIYMKIADLFEPAEIYNRDLFDLWDSIEAIDER